MKLSQSKYNRLAVMGVPKPKIIRGRKNWFVAVACDCGVKKSVNARDLVAGKIKSCGCLKTEAAIQNIQEWNEMLFDGDVEHPNKTHGGTHEDLYIVWKGMRGRCYQPSNHKYSRYGGRGIKILWPSYEDFREDMEDSYRLHRSQNSTTQIDRIDNNGPYSKKNCRWSTAREQSNNTSRNRKITYRGETLSVSQWSRKLGIPRSTINSRIHILNLTRPVDILRI